MDYEKLQRAIEAWGDRSHPYDITGMLNLLRTAASSLATNSSPDALEPESICEIFEPSEVAFLEAIVTVYHRGKKV